VDKYGIELRKTEFILDNRGFWENEYDDLKKKMRELIYD